VKVADDLPTRGSTMHLTSTLEGGGAERLLTNYVTQHRSPTAHAYVVCLRRDGVFRSTLESAGVEVINIGADRRRDGLAGLFRLARLIRRRRPAVVQAWMYEANVFASVALRLAGRSATRLIWGIFCSDLAAHRNVWQSWRPRLWRGLGKLLSPNVDGIIYNADEARDFHRSIGFREPRSLVIQNCIDTEMFAPDPDLRQPVRREIGVPDDAVMIVTAARIDPMKNWAGALAAVRDIPGVVTVGIGTGTDKLPPQPGFIGLGWRDDVQRVYNAADIFLLASGFGEGTSLALVEAMACGVPCVVTDVGGNGTVIGNAGIVVPPGPVAPVRDALLRLAGDRRRRDEMGQAARARVAELHVADDAAATLRLLSHSAGAGP
jgi:glycosyltransferase involved in cell wall biosynthesis